MRNSVGATSRSFCESAEFFGPQYAAAPVPIAWTIASACAIGIHDWASRPRTASQINSGR